MKDADGEGNGECSEEEMMIIMKQVIRWRERERVVIILAGYNREAGDEGESKYGDADEEYS